MESLSFTSDTRERPLAGDAELQVDSFTRSRNLVQGWNAESFPVMLSDIFQGMESIESGLLDMPRKSIISTQRLVDDTNCGSDKSSISVPTITPDASVAIDSSFSNLAAEIRANKLEQTSLKNMKLVTSRESSKCDQFSVENSLFSQDPALSIKRVRLENFRPQIPVCLVHGCNKDLSSLKEYHRKHKVCDIHSKTSVVVVNGAHQRFCQQCSRFHILSEFDEGKRSCRKRLADHNERRRRPQLDTQFGAMLFNTDFFSWQCNEPNSHIRPLKLQKGTTQISNSVAPQAFGPWQYPLETSLNSPLLAVELSGSYTSFAHSLLSAQSQSLLINSEIPELANQKTCQPLEEITSSYSEARIPDSSVSLSFETPRNEPAGARTANTVDLLQLSLHLQRVQEQLKNSAPENVIFTS